MAVALCIACSQLRLLTLPAGGSISLAVVPILAFALVRGPRAGLLAGACAGLGNALAGGTVVHPVQYLLDYGLAYAVLGLAGLAAGRSAGVQRMAIVAVMALHLVCMTASGVIFFAPVAGDAALAYALAYNAATVLPETLIALAVVPAAARAIARGLGEVRTARPRTVSLPARRAAPMSADPSTDTGGTTADTALTPPTAVPTGRVSAARATDIRRPLRLARPALAPRR